MAKIVHHTFSDEKLDDKKKAKYVKEKMKSDEYHNLLMGNYEGASGFELKYDLPWHESKHNTPENNRKVFDAMRGKKLGAEHDGVELEHLTKHGKFDDKTIKHILDKTSRHDAAYEGLSQNEKLTDKQLKMVAQHLVEKNPDEKGGGKHLSNIVSHPNVNAEIVNYISDNKEKIREPGDLHESLVTSERLDNEKRASALEGLRAKDSRTFDKALSNFTPAQRKKFINRKLGIEGGKHSDDPEEGEFDAQNAAWGEENFVRGRDYDKYQAATLAGSKYLTDAQAEHIKRHGNFGQKIALFENEHVDPRHATEMWQKWHEDTPEDDYNQDDFKDHLKEQHRDALYQDAYDSGEAREQAEENYSFDDYLRDSGGYFGRTKRERDNNKFHDDYHEHLKGKFDWKAENPDYNRNKPESEDNPREIDYANESGYSIEDHPEYEDRYNDDANQQDWVDNTPEGERARESMYDGYYDSLGESESDAANQIVREKEDDLMYDYDYLPGHLKDKIPHINQQKEMELEAKRRGVEKKVLEEELQNKSFLESAIPQHQATHEFGPHMHHLQLLKDYADANGGVIGIDKMNRAYPNLKETLKQHFDKPKLSSQELQARIDKTPKKTYALSFGKWKKSNMQNSTHTDQVVMRLDHSPETLKELSADPAVKKEFDDITEMSQASGHPVNANTIGWARIDTSNPKHWVIDEMQSDLENKGIRPMLEKAAKEKGEKVDEGRIKALEKINDLHQDWRENLLTAVKNHAKANGAETIITHSPESKANHTGADTEHTVYKESYHRAPRQLGFVAKPVHELNIPDEMRSVFNRREEVVSGAISKHHSAMKEHLEHAMAHQELAGVAHEQSQGSLFEGMPQIDTTHTQTHQKLAQHHLDMARSHQKKIAEMDPEHGAARRTVQNLMPPQADVTHKELATKTAKEGGKPFVHEHDQLLKPGASSGATIHGHVLELNPEKIKERLAKAELEELHDKLTLLKSLMGK